MAHGLGSVGLQTNRPAALIEGHKKLPEKVISTQEVKGDAELLRKDHRQQKPYVSNTGSDNLSVLLGNGNGTFQSPVNYSVGDAPQNVVIADVNKDGKKDVITPNKLDNTFTIRMGNGDGTFGSAKNYIAHWDEPKFPHSVR